MSIFPGPQPEFTNPIIEPTNFSPRVFIISGVVKGLTSRIITTEEHDFVEGQRVRIRMPQPYGMDQIDNEEGFILEVSSSIGIIIDLDTRGYNDFIAAPLFAATSPQVFVVTNLNFNREGEFENIS